MVTLAGFRRLGLASLLNEARRELRNRQPDDKGSHTSGSA